MPTTDYRTSHTAPEKGRTYDEDFRGNRHRAVMWRMEQRILTKIVKKYFGEKEFRLLDFACGTGRILSHLESYASESTGVDLSKAMLEVARSKVKQSEIIEADITRDEVLKGREFDMITAFRFFPNAEPSLRKDAMRSLVSRLAPGGIMVFNNHKNIDSSLLKVARLLGRFNAREIYMSAAEVSDLVTSSGLEVADRFHLGVLPVTEKHTILPSSPLHFCESLLSKVKLVRGLARYHIYVCRKTTK